MRFLLKVLLSSLVIASVSEIARRSNAFAAVMASLPLTSILALTWLYWDTGDARRVSDLSMSIFWAVLPSLLFFLVLPLGLKRGFSFPISLLSSCGIMAAGYSGY